MSKKVNYMCTTIYLRDKDNGCELECLSVSEIDRFIGKPRYRKNNNLFFHGKTSDYFVDKINKEVLKELKICKRSFGYFLNYKTKYEVLNDAIQLHELFIEFIKN